MLKTVVLLFLLTTACLGERIVTLGPAVTNQLMLLGVGDEIVGKTDYCAEEAGKKGEVISVGSLLSFSVESILLLNPTTVFASGLTPEGLKKKMRSVGLKLVIVDDPASYTELCNNFRNISKALNKESVADSILLECDSVYRALKANSAEKKHKRIFFQLGTKPLYSVVKNSLGDELISLIGGVNVFNEAQSGIVSRESIVLSDPEVIFISQMGKMAEKEKETWNSFDHLSAVKNGSVFLVDAYAVGSPTPVSFLETVATFSKMIDSSYE